MRILVAGILGGIAMYVWSTIAHTVLPLGQVGIGQIPQEQSVVDSLHGALGDNDGLFLFPWLSSMDSAATKAYAAKLQSNPSGLLVYHPPGASPSMVRPMIVEFFTEVFEAIIAAWLLAQSFLAIYAARVLFVGVIGVVAAVTTNIPYWTWYGFPANYTVSAVIMVVVGYLIAGLVIAAVLRPRAPAMS